MFCHISLIYKHIFYNDIEEGVTMFEFLFREKVYETTDSNKKFEIGCKFKENHIDYKIKTDDLSKRNVFDSMKMGNVVKSRYVYSFWVKKDQSVIASCLVKGE